MSNPFSSVSHEPNETAKSLLVHYLQNAAKGFAPTTPDNFAEISDLVDSIVDAAVQKAIAKIENKKHDAVLVQHLSDDQQTIF